MHQALPLAAAIFAAVLAFGPPPAHAGYGAIAYDQQNGKEGASWDRPTPAEANEAALKQCGSADCQIGRASCRERV